MNTTTTLDKKNNRNIRRVVIFFTALGMLAVVSLLSLRFGSVEYTTSQLLDVLRGEGSPAARAILINIRLPRILIALMVGMNLAMAGALLQAVMRNPLADPGLTGVSTGASLSAVTIMLVFPQFASFVPAAAFIGGCIACFFVYILAWKKGVDPIRIILAGVAVNAILGGGTSLLSILYSDKIQGVLMWLNGSIAGKSWYHAGILFPYSVVGLVIALLCIKWANLLQLGDEMAKNLGLKVNVARLILSVMAAFLAGISVSTVGLIGFIGLVIPHISRLLVGSDYRFMLPLSAVLGSTLLVLADTVARTAFSPIELPVGVIMAIVGGPFFLYLLRKGGGYKV
jgi:iron complex transport system permease protein